MQLNLFWHSLQIFKKEPPIISKKSAWGYVWNYNYSSLSQLIDWGVVISLQTFYDLYKKNPDIRQSVRKIANSVSRNGIYLEDNDWKVIEDRELQDVVLWYLKTPTFLNFKIDLFRNYLLSWEVYVTPMSNLKWEVVWFEVLDSRSMTKIVDIYWNIKKYKQANSKGATKEYKAEDICYFQLETDINNSNLWMWLLHWVIWDALSDLEATKTNYMFYENNAIPNSILLLENTLSDKEMMLAKEQFNTQYKGTGNAHKMLIGGWVKDIKTLSVTPRDMEFINQRKMTTEKISAVFWVPKSILGYVDNVNYANAKELRKEYLEWTIIPYQNDFENILNTIASKFLPLIYENYWIRCDWEQVDETEIIYENQRKDIALWVISINEARLDRWLEASKDENADKLMINRNMVLLEDITLDATLNPNEQ